MFERFRKKERIEEVVRVEDLRRGDILQYDLHTRIKVLAVRKPISYETEVVLDRIPNPDRPHEYEKITLCRELKVIVWR